MKLLGHYSRVLVALLAGLLAVPLWAQPMVWVAGGSFTPLYGSSKQPVVLAGFSVDQYPVSNADFQRFLQQQPQWRRGVVKPLFADSGYLSHWAAADELGAKAPADAPVVNVSWFAARAYCQAQGQRLPSVNEWEYLAAQPIPGADTRQLILDWYSQPTPAVLPPVTQGLRNSAGVSALHGLIWEWTLDFNSSMVTGESRADGSLNKSLFCGAGAAGAANPEDYAAFMRFAFRSSLKASYTVNNLGFRCVNPDGKSS